MQQYRLAIVGFIAGFVCIPTPASAVSYTVATAAGACAWDASTSEFAAEYDGALTLQTARSVGTEHRVTCDLGYPAPASVSFNPIVYFSDTNAGADMADDFYCNVYSCNMSGSSCSNPGTRFGNATGGSSTPTGYSGGSGFINWTSAVSRSSYLTSAAWCNVPGANAGNLSQARRYWVSWN